MVGLRSMVFGHLDAVIKECVEKSVKENQLVWSCLTNKEIQDASFEVYKVSGTTATEIRVRIRLYVRQWVKARKK